MSQKVLELLSQFGGLRQTSNGWTARCPAHDDNKSSLSIGNGTDGRLLLKCHAGCSNDLILRTLGLTMADLMPFPSHLGNNGFQQRVNKNGVEGFRKPPLEFKSHHDAFSCYERKFGPVSVCYEYHDFHGRLVGVIGRWNNPDGKEIRPVSLVGNAWRFTSIPSPRPLYRLNEISQNNRIYVVEGEKCVEAARSMGLVATTSSGGAAAFKKSDWGPLIGKEIIILPDNDPPGEMYAKNVAAHLLTLEPGMLVKIVSLPGLPAGGDLVDWPTTTGIQDPVKIRENLEMLINKAPRFQAIEHSLRVHPESENPVRIIREKKSELVEPFPEPHEDIFPGILGEIVEELKDQSEADPVAVTAQLLTYLGNAIGRGPHFLVERDRHGGNLFVVLVGESAKGRKGTSQGIVECLASHADPVWASTRWVSGLSSGEGLIYPIRDPETDGNEADLGSEDKRLLVRESEFARVLNVMRREGNILSPLLREGWDGKPLQNLTKNHPMRCRTPHISIVGHITKVELQELLLQKGRTDLFNGTANRFLWVAVRRGKLLPFGGNYNIEKFGSRMVEIVSQAKSLGRFDWLDDDAREFWAETYRGELAEDPGGVLSALTAREAPLALRLALLYAILDKAKGIGATHLGAAMALCRYCRESVIWAFGQGQAFRMGNEAKIKEALVLAGPNGMTATQFRDLFHRPRINRVWRDPLEEMVKSGQVRHSKEGGALGRQKEVWSLNL